MLYFILPSVVYYLYVSFSRFIISVGEASAGFFCFHLLVILLFLFGGVSSSPGCFGKGVLFYCGTPWAFNITILHYYLHYFVRLVYPLKIFRLFIPHYPII